MTRRRRVRPRTTLSVALVLGALALAFAVPHWSTRYGAALVVFSIWMAWFVDVVADILQDPERE